MDYDQTVTALPETQPHVEGVVDLRGRTTAVVDPKRLLDTGGDHPVVFENEDGNPSAG